MKHAAPVADPAKKVIRRSVPRGQTVDQGADESGQVVGRRGRVVTGRAEPRQEPAAALSHPTSVAARASVTAPEKKQAVGYLPTVSAAEPTLSTILPLPEAVKIPQNVTGACRQPVEEGADGPWVVVTSRRKRCVV
jgi:hypothetical protein